MRWRRVTLIVSVPIIPAQTFSNAHKNAQSSRSDLVAGGFFVGRSGAVWSRVFTLAPLPSIEPAGYTNHCKRECCPALSYVQHKPKLEATTTIVEVYKSSAILTEFLNIPDLMRATHRCELRF